MEETKLPKTLEDWIKTSADRYAGHWRAPSPNPKIAYELGASAMAKHLMPLIELGKNHHDSSDVVCK